MNNKFLNIKLFFKLIISTLIVKYLNNNVKEMLNKVTQWAPIKYIERCDLGSQFEKRLNSVFYILLPRLASLTCSYLFPCSTQVARSVSCEARLSKFYFRGFQPVTRKCQDAPLGAALAQDMNSGRGIDVLEHAEERATAQDINSGRGIDVWEHAKERATEAL